MRRAIRQKIQSSDFDEKLNEAIDKIIGRCNPEWEIVLDYLRSLTLILEIAPENGEAIKANYHRKAQITAIIKRLGGLEEI